MLGLFRTVAFVAVVLAVPEIGYAADQVLPVKVSQKDTSLFQVEGSDYFVKTALGCMGKGDAVLWLYERLVYKGELIFKKDDSLGTGRCDVVSVVKIDLQGCCSSHGGFERFLGGMVMCKDQRPSPSCTAF